MRLWSIYLVGYYSAATKINTMNFVGKWMELERMILSEVTLTQEDKSHVFFHWRLLAPNLQPWINCRNQEHLVLKALVVLLLSARQFQFCNKLHFKY